MGNPKGYGIPYLSVQPEMELPRFGVPSLFKVGVLKKKPFWLLLVPGVLMGTAETAQGRNLLLFLSGPQRASSTSLSGNHRSCFSLKFQTVS